MCWVFVGKSREIDLVKGLGIDGRITIKWSQRNRREEWEGVDWVVRLRLRTMSGLL